MTPQVIRSKISEQVDVRYINADVRWLTVYRLSWANTERKPSTCHPVKEAVLNVSQTARYLIWDAAERAKAGIKVGPDVLRDVHGKTLSFMPLARPRESVGIISDSDAPPFSSPAYPLFPICNRSRSGKPHDMASRSSVCKPTVEHMWLQPCMRHRIQM